VQERDTEIAALRAESEKQSELRHQAEAVLAQAVSDREQAEEAKWQAIRQREQAEAALAQAISDREQADEAKWQAVRQREQAEEARWQAIREREQADESKVRAIRERDQLASMRVKAEAAKHLQWKDVPHLEKQGLFIVGHARSGTSVLLQALDTSPDIFLLAEANLYVEGLRTDFSRWFNDMHRQFGNTLWKGSYCPATAQDDANGPETLQWLAQRFRYVGEKLAFRSETLGYNPAAFFEFHARHFFTSHYVCIVRNPADVLKSNDDMFKPENLAIYADSYLQTLVLILELVDTFPNVLVVFHENIDQATFATIGAWLGVDLTSAFALYEGHYQKEGRWGGDNAHLPMIDKLIEAHARMRRVFSPETLRPLPSREWKMLPYHIRAMRAEAATAAAVERAVDLIETPRSAAR
jgi:hypothetical protein